MRRAIWVGVAVVVAVAAVVPLWLVLDDDGERTSAALAQTSGGGVGELTIAGINGGSPFGVRAFSWQPGQGTGTGTKTTPGRLQVVRGIDAVSPPLFRMGVNNTLAPTAKLQLFLPGTKTVFATYDMKDVRLESYADATSESLGLYYQEITVATAGETTPNAPAADVVGQLQVPDLGKETVPITGFNVGFSAAGSSVDFRPASLVRPLDGLAPALGRRAEVGPKLTTVTVELIEPGETSPYATYELSDVVVSSLVDAGSAGEAPQQNIELSYSKVRETIGGATACYEVSTGKTC